MASHKVDRASEDIKRELNDILRSVKDPRVTGMLSIVRLELTNDYSFCKVYVSSLEGLEHAAKAVEGLVSASGFIRHELSLRVKLRHTPKLIFIPDGGVEKSAQINDILHEIIKD